MKLGQFGDDEAAKEERRREEEDAAKNIAVGSRCEVCRPGLLAKRGTVKYVGEWMACFASNHPALLDCASHSFCTLSSSLSGETKFQPGLWVGIQYDEPSGKNDGRWGLKTW